MKKINVNCPHCKKEFEYYSSDYRPFCSKQCKMVDLNGWLDGDYIVSGREGSVYIEDEEALEKIEIILKSSNLL